MQLTLTKENLKLCPNEPGVYAIYCTWNGFIYIGSAKKVISGSYSGIRRRLLQHLKALENQKHHNPLLQRCFNKYGASEFTFHVLKVCPDSETVKHEIDFICNWWGGYGSKNRSFNATDAVTSPAKLHPDTYEKIAKANSKILWRIYNPEGEEFLTYNLCRFEKNIGISGLGGVASFEFRDIRGWRAYRADTPLEVIVEKLKGFKKKNQEVKKARSQANVERNQKLFIVVPEDGTFEDSIEVINLVEYCKSNGLSQKAVFSAVQQQTCHKGFYYMAADDRFNPKCANPLFVTKCKPKHFYLVTTPNQESFEIINLNLYCKIKNIKYHQVWQKLKDSGIAVVNDYKFELIPALTLN